MTMGDLITISLRSGKANFPELHLIIFIKKPRKNLIDIIDKDRRDREETYILDWKKCNKKLQIFWMAAFDAVSRIYINVYVIREICEKIRGFNFLSFYNIAYLIKIIYF